MRRLLRHALSVSIAASHHQDILDALAHKARDHDDPLRNPVAYAIELCNRVRNGTFQRVGPPIEPTVGQGTTAAPSGPNITLLRSQLLGEIAGLRRLRRASGEDAAGAMIERQIADLELRLTNTRGEGR
jgi:hypothetical protein